MALLAVEDALKRILAAIPGPVSSEHIPVEQALDRTLAADMEARLTMPPFHSSAMDGYALRSSDITNSPVTLQLAGISQAGAGYDKVLKAGEAVRIFTGAPVPEGADAVLMQEKAETGKAQAGKGQTGEGFVTALVPLSEGANIRPKGNDFKAGETLLKTRKRLAAADLSLIAAMGHSHISVYRKPLVAILATGNELVPPHIIPQRSQIIASSVYAVQALARKEGAEVINAGIAPDDPSALHEAFERLEALNPDVIVTLGGASVGDHDYIRAVLSERDFSFDFWRIAMKPGKPMIHGLLKKRTLLGLPGNPVSAFICSLLFLVPVIRALSGDAEAGQDPSECAVLGCDVEQNKDRQDYMRATLQQDFNALPFHALPLVTPLPEQDSSQLYNLTRAKALLIRTPFAPMARKGDSCRIIRF